MIGYQEVICGTVLYEEVRSGSEMYEDGAGHVRCFGD